MYLRHTKNGAIFGATLYVLLILLILYVMYVYGFVFVVVMLYSLCVKE